MKIRKISFNSKVILTLVLATIVVHLLSYVSPNFVANFFVAKSRATMSFTNPLTYFSLIFYVLVHTNTQHLFSNLAFLLLLGPLLEEKYGHLRLFLMILFTALIAGLINTVLFSTSLVGASGIVFMLIILASFVGKKDSSIPVEFLLVAAIFLGREIFGMMKDDNISQSAHILGGICGAGFGFLITKKKEN